MIIATLASIVAFREPQQTPALGQQINTWDISTFADDIWVGKDIDTTLVATNTARSYLEISNISGATTTAGTLYCNLGGKDATIYTASPVVVFASSTRVWSLDGIYTGAIHCKLPFASSTIQVWEK